jgi:hypothetical protein
MALSIDDIREAAFGLGELERKELMLDLLDSLELWVDFSDYNAAWAEELSDRCEAYRRGEVEALDYKEAMRQIEDELKCHSPEEP